MCGINGIFAYHSAASAPTDRELVATRDAMRARGPDGSGSWWSAHRRCALGHRRLAVLDLKERAAQPMTDEEGHSVVVFNGEIYNYPELRAELEEQGTRFRTSCDTEVLLHLYGFHGAEMVSRLRGMFAFAIWDSSRNGLFLARDPYGIKPLYTANDGWCFRFASQVKALQAGGGISRDLEPAGLVGFHLFGSVPEPFTLYRDIRALPAGHTQWIDAAGPREPKPFVKLAAILAESRKNSVPPHVLAREVGATLRDSVAAHLLADVEVGLFLSAGVDSGALLGLMRDAGHKSVRALTLAFEEFRGTAEDEVPSAARIARYYGAQHMVSRVTEDAFRSDLPSMLEAMDQPSIDGINTWLIAKAAKDAGLKVAISGLGGDELLAGYPSFVQVPRWRRRFGPMARVPGAGRLARGLMKTLAPGLVQKQPKAVGMLEFAGDWAGAYLLQRGLHLPGELPQILNRDVAQEGLRRLGPLNLLNTSLVPDPGSDTGRVCVLESTHYLRNQLLRDADWAGMAHGVEIRTPFVDISVLNRLGPVIAGLEPGAGKAALAQAPTRPLPIEILTRPKTGFTVPTGAWLKTVTGTGSSEPETTHAPKGLVSRQWSRRVLADWEMERAEAQAA